VDAGAVPAVSRPEIFLDPEAARRDTTRRHWRLNLVEYPVARLVGNALLLGGVALHNVYVLREFDPAGFTRLAVGLTAYSLLSWLALYAFWTRAWERARRIDLGVLFMALDVVAWTFVIYYSGGERSWLFFAMIMRAADQRLAGVRRVLLFGLWSVVCYASLLGWLVAVEHRPLSLAAEATKLVLIVAANLYLATAARTADHVQSTMVAAMRTARQLLAHRDEAVAGQRETEASYRTLFETANDPIMTSALDGTITSVNRAFEAATGYTRDELIGRHDSTLTTAHVAQASEDRRRRALEGERLDAAEVIGVRKDGARVPYEVRTALLRDRAERPVGYVSVYRDVSAHKEIEATLERAKALAEETSRAKTHFLANMSHELRTPLNSIIGFTRLLLKRSEGELGGRQEAYVRSVHDSSVHLLTLINSVLDLSRIEAGKQAINPEPLALRPLVEECLDSTRSLVLGKRVTLEHDVPSDLPELEADRPKLKQVLLNLLANAARFTTVGRVRVAARVSGEGVHVSVSDTGVGIPAPEIPRLFEPFHHVRSPLGHEAGGTGLGLTITKQLVELHGGRIWVESVEGQGTTFHVLIPRRPA
jgi:PAS domain S-box-containing protein